MDTTAKMEPSQQEAINVQMTPEKQQQWKLFLRQQEDSAFQQLVSPQLLSQLQPFSRSKSATGDAGHVDMAKQGQ